jgi:hypothetical protein
MAVRIPIVTDFEGKGIQRARKEFSQLENVGAKTAFALKKAFLPATVAIGALVSVGVKAVNAASDLSEETAKAGQIFGKSGKEIEKFAKTAAQTFGQSRRQATQAASTFAVFGKAAGLSGKQLVDFATDFTVLASDLASFNNSSPEEAITAIGAALRGESEPIRRYGVLLNDATLKQRALSMGLIETTKEALTPQTKALAAAAEIYAQTGDAQGDFARTSQGLANQQRTLAASLEDVQAAIGEGLLPVVEAVLPIIQRFAEWAAKNPQVFRTVAAAVAVLTASIVALNVALALNPIVLITGSIIALAAVMALNWPKVKKFFEDFRAEIDKTLGPLDELVALFFKGFGQALDIGKSIFQGSGSSFNDLANKPKRKMASGGLAMTPTSAIIGEAGPELVIPLDRLGQFGGGNNVTINVSGGDPQAVVDALRRYMYQNGTVPIRVSG